MGTCLSALTSPASIVDVCNGGEAEYHAKYIEDKTLGEGEFGVVKLINVMATNEVRAVKILKKGVTFKDNTLYSPLKPEILRQECEILRKLGGLHFNIALEEVYESSKLIWMVTEFCAGGDMMHWISNNVPELRTETVSRVAFQLLDAISHCHAHHIIHRDIKPENVMFVEASDTSSLRLIDFGSSTLDEPTPEPITHTTYAGSAFYISPELFQRTYTHKTDIWSIGVALYVLVAGYPGEQLQKAFNLLQSSKQRDLRNLPNMPDDLPLPFFEMMDEMLRYKHKTRKEAKEIMEYEFVQFHQDADEHGEISFNDIANEASDVKNFEGEGGSRSQGRSRSSVIAGSVHRHARYIGYQKFEKIITTMLATMLKDEEYKKLIKELDKEISKESDANMMKLKVVKVKKLIDTLKSLGHQRVVFMIEELPNASAYEQFSYHIELLQLFTLDSQHGESNLRMSTIKKPAKKETQDKRNNSVHGNNVWQNWKKSPAHVLSKGKSDAVLDSSSPF